ncbi:MAG: hypothetical protein LAP85_16910 [Acidobacteriia bacterium]|nr:hypothetical protein [Terriglobia bacterium]
MTGSPLTLRVSLSQLQRAVAKLYSQLQQRFEGNTLVSRIWASMDHDLQAQVASLKKLPPSFWQSLKKQEKELTHAAGSVLPQSAERPAGHLPSCLAQALDTEEPIILKVYAPLIRRLRIDWTNLALDFYVVVKAHIARLAESIQLYSGDPALGLRCAVLLQNFEKEVQEQAVIEAAPARSRSKKAASARHIGKAAARKRVQISAKKKPTRSLDKMAKRAKPIVAKIKLSRRRAQR